MYQPDHPSSPLGLTQAGLWTAACSYVSQALPNDLKPSCHLVVNAFHGSLGSGLGAIISGLLVDQYGWCRSPRCFVAVGCFWNFNSQLWLISVDLNNSLFYHLLLLRPGKSLHECLLKVSVVTEPGKKECIFSSSSFFSTGVNHESWNSCSSIVHSATDGIRGNKQLFLPERRPGSVNHSTSGFISTQALWKEALIHVWVTMKLS